MSARNLDLARSGNGRPAWVLRILVLLVMATGAITGIIYRQQVVEAASRFFAPPDEDPIPVVALKRTSFQLEVPAFGEVSGLETTPVPTPATRTGGLKVAWLIPEGSMVEAGEVLVRFDSTEARLNLERQQNTLDSTGKRIDLQRGKQTTDEKLLNIDQNDARMEYEYAVSVMPQDQDIFSKWDIIEAQINAGLAKEKINFLSEKLKVNKRSARADMQILAIDKNKAQGEIGIAQQTLNSLELRAPKGGLVLYRRDRMRDPQVGDESWPGQSLVELVDLSLLQARLHILEMDAGQVAKGQPVVVRLDSMPDKEYHGVVKSVAALAQPLERNSPLKYFESDVLVQDVGADLRRIKPGMSLKAEVILDKYESVYVVPNSAVGFKDGKTRVYVREGKDFVPRGVELGSRNHGQTVVLDGLKDNELLAMRDPFETRKAHLPDFSKAGAQDAGGVIRGMGGPGMRIMIRH